MEGLRILAAGWTIANSRPHNDDRLYPPELSQTAFHRSLDEPLILAVADGMGGGRDGAGAAEAALKPLVGLLEGADRGPLAGRLVDAVVDANRQIVSMAGGPLRSGSTLTLLGVEDGRLAVAHVGDSRAYLFSKGELELLTKDQNLYGDHLEDGWIPFVPSRLELAPEDESFLAEWCGREAEYLYRPAEPSPLPESRADLERHLSEKLATKLHTLADLGVLKLADGLKSRLSVSLGQDRDLDPDEVVTLDRPEPGPPAPTLRCGDIVMLCTDGLSGFAEEQDVTEVLAVTARDLALLPDTPDGDALREQVVEGCVASLISLAQRSGSDDNIGIVVAAVHRGEGRRDRTGAASVEPDTPGPNSPSLAVTPEEDGGDASGTAGRVAVPIPRDVQVSPAVDPAEVGPGGLAGQTARPAADRGAPRGPKEEDTAPTSGAARAGKEPPRGALGSRRLAIATGLFGLLLGVCLAGTLLRPGDPSRVRAQPADSGAAAAPGGDGGGGARREAGDSLPRLFYVRLPGLPPSRLVSLRVVGLERVIMLSLKARRCAGDGPLAGAAVARALAEPALSPRGVSAAAARVPLEAASFAAFDRALLKASERLVLLLAPGLTRRLDLPLVSGRRPGGGCNAPGPMLREAVQELVRLDRLFGWRSWRIALARTRLTLAPKRPPPKLRGRHLRRWMKEVELPSLKRLVAALDAVRRRLPPNSRSDADQAVALVRRSLITAIQIHKARIQDLERQ